MVVLFSRVFVGDKSVYSRLQKILGLGSVTAKRFCALLGCNVKTGLKESGRILFRLEWVVQDFRRSEALLVQVDLREYLEAVLNRKVQIRSYAGFRHWINMPVHGQRTHSNNGTQRRLGKMRKFVRPEQFFVVEQSSRDWRMRNRKRVLSKSERNRVVLMEKQKQRAQLRLKKRLKRIGKKKRS